MKYRAIDWLLLGAVLIGGVLAWLSGRERTRLSRSHARLVRMTGDLRIADPSKVYFLALDTGEPLHYAWRVYLPPNYKAALRQRFGGGSTSSSSQSSEFIARVLLREDRAPGILQIYTHFGAASSVVEIKERALFDLLRNRWEKLELKQLGAPQLAVLKSDQASSLLRLSLPEDLAREAREKIPAGPWERYVPVLFELTLDPKSSGQ
jgi:hypothetical protein